MKDKVNIAPFVVGDEVISLGSGQTHDGKGCIKKGLKYTVKSICFRSDIYLNNENEGGLWLLDFFETYGSYPSQYFRKVQEQHAPLISFESIKESETKKESQEQEILIPN